jgi:hypothetical protein
MTARRMVGAFLIRSVRQCLDDLLVHVLLLPRVEGHAARRHLEDQDSHRPPVHRLAVTAVLDHLFGVEIRVSWGRGPLEWNSTFALWAANPQAAVGALGLCQ